MTYIMLKKTLTLSYVREKFSNPRDLGKKILTQTKSPIPSLPHKSYMVNHIESGGRGGFDTLLNVIHQQNGWRVFIMLWFSRLNFVFQD